MFFDSLIWFKIVAYSILSSRAILLHTVIEVVIIALLSLCCLMLRAVWRREEFGMGVRIRVFQFTFQNAYVPYLIDKESVFILS